MSSISEEIREIEQEIASLYRRKRNLEEERQRQWEKMFPPMTAVNDTIWMADSEINYDYLVDNALWG